VEMPVAARIVQILAVVVAHGDVTLAGVVVSNRSAQKMSLHGLSGPGP